MYSESLFSRALARAPKTEVQKLAQDYSSLSVEELLEVIKLEKKASLYDNVKEPLKALGTAMQNSSTAERAALGGLVGAGAGAASGGGLEYDEKNGTLRPRSRLKRALVGAAVGAGAGSLTSQSARTAIADKSKELYEKTKTKLEKKSSIQKEALSGGFQQGVGRLVGSALRTHTPQRLMAGAAVGGALGAGKHILLDGNDPQTGERKGSLLGSTLAGAAAGAGAGAIAQPLSVGLSGGKGAVGKWVRQGMHDAGTTMSANANTAAAGKKLVNQAHAMNLYANKPPKPAPGTPPAPAPTPGGAPAQPAGQPAAGAAQPPAAAGTGKGAGKPPLTPETAKNEEVLKLQKKRHEELLKARAKAEAHEHDLAKVPGKGGATQSTSGLTPAEIEARAAHARRQQAQQPAAPTPQPQTASKTSWKENPEPAQVEGRTSVTDRPEVVQAAQVRAAELQARASRGNVSAGVVPRDPLTQVRAGGGAPTTTQGTLATPPAQPAAPAPTVSARPEVQAAAAAMPRPQATGYAPTASAPSVRELQQAQAPGFLPDASAPSVRENIQNSVPAEAVPTPAPHPLSREAAKRNVLAGTEGHVDPRTPPAPRRDYVREHELYNQQGIAFPPEEWVRRELAQETAEGAYRSRLQQPSYAESFMAANRGSPQPSHLPPGASQEAVRAAAIMAASRAAKTPQVAAAAEGLPRVGR